MITGVEVAGIIAANTLAFLIPVGMGLINMTRQLTRVETKLDMHLEQHKEKS